MFMQKPVAKAIKEWEQNEIAARRPEKMALI